MASIKSRKHSAVQHSRLYQTAALTLLSLALPGAAVAQQAPITTLPAVNVNARSEAGYKADTASSPKLTQPLLDTPQTVQVIKKEILQEQGANSLMEALRNTPGITMQLGENGNTSAGDTFQMRGFSTQTATFIDGIRDLGAITRDVFNLEQVEVVKGPAGADIGRGATSGYINLVTKLPLLEDTSTASLAAGTADRKRITADVNRKLGDTAAFRLNAMGQKGGVDERNQVENESYGLAPSFSIGLGTPTRFHLYSQHVRQDNVPDGGIPTIGMEGFYNADASLRAGAKVNRKNFYGSPGDYEKIDADMVTAKLEHDLGSGTTISNIARYGKTTVDRVLTGINTLAATDPADPATWTVSRSRQRIDQENEILANLTNLTTQFDTGGIKHSLSAGLELMYERQKTLGFATTGLTVPAASLYAPNVGDALPTPFATGAYTDGDTVTAAVYAFDTLELNERWLLNGGVRLEHYRTETAGRTVVTTGNSASYPGYTVGQLAPDQLSASDNLLSWKAGAVYKPAANGSIYLAYANSLTPPGGGNFALSNAENNANNAALDPQETRSVELGTKWDLLDRRLNLSAAVYRTENDKQVSYDSLAAAFVQFGKTRVDGIELAAVGQLTDFWQVSAGVARMRTKVLDQFNASGTETTGVRWSPDLTATLWTSYTLGQLTLGAGARYTSDQKRVITAGTNLATQNMPEIPSYWVADLMAAYRLSKTTNLRLNVYNVFDEEYINTLNNSGARMTLGTPRSAMLSAEFAF